MGDFIKVIEGVVRLILGIVVTIVGAYILPATMDLMDGVTGSILSSTVTGIIWLGIIGVWIMAVIIWPFARILEGLQSE